MKHFFLLHFLLLNSLSAIELDCNFVSYSIDGYNCKVENLKVKDNEKEITIVKGQHLPGKNNRNVDTLYIPSADCVTSLPVGVSKHFVNLKKLEVTYGSLKNIAKSDFSGLISLQTIFITKTLLSSIPENTFDNLLRLETLILSDNKIRELKLKTFEKLSSLKKLSLSANSLEILRSKVFEQNLKLEEIDLSNNKLRVIDATTFSHLKYLKKVSLEGNFCTTKSFVNDFIKTDLIAELSNKCTNEIVKSSKLTEMNHEIFKLQQIANSSSQEIKTINENLVKKLLEIDKIESEKQKLINDVVDFRVNLTIADENNKDVEFRLNEAYKTIRQVKIDFDIFKENCLKVEENYLAIMNEKIEQEILQHNKTTETFESAESSGVFFIKTAHISSSSVFILLLVTVAALAGNILLIIVIIRVKKTANVSSKDELEMGDKNQNDTK